MSSCIEPVIGGPIQLRKTYPHRYYGTVNGKKIFVALRREVLEKRLGRPPTAVGCSCNNRMCINPDHLFDSTAAAISRTRSNKAWAKQKALYRV